MDAFEPVKNSGKSSKKPAYAKVVANSNDKGLRRMNCVHELQVHNNEEKNIIYLRACMLQKKCKVQSKIGHQQKRNTQDPGTKM